jgi:hypothetical protein
MRYEASRSSSADQLPTPNLDGIRMERVVPVRKSSHDNAARV